ncbi:hypothetical protein BDZ94DRAFT_572199 [Collybia nuda]|uniref:Uncharacterized protein n=1 Tax=Collybia nuda TaxID=64659 RepID=A0A9P5YFP7_9AGAR|nr:hypothetical protein BDZ94DRAFT_572199 [Collybia nuda]
MSNIWVLFWMISQSYLPSSYLLTIFGGIFRHAFKIKEDVRIYHNDYNDAIEFTVGNGNCMDSQNRFMRHMISICLMSNSRLPPGQIEFFKNGQQLIQPLYISIRWLGCNMSPLSKYQHGA